MLCERNRRPGTIASAQFRSSLPRAEPHPPSARGSSSVRARSRLLVLALCSAHPRIVRLMFSAPLWDWGGNLVVHEIVQAADGTLQVRMPDRVAAHFQQEQAVALRPVLGDWSQSDSRYTALSLFGFACAMGGSLPTCCLVSARFQFKSDTRRLGIILRATQKPDKGYHIQFEPDRSRIDQLKRAIKLGTSGVIWEITSPRHLSDGSTTATLVRFHPFAPWMLVRPEQVF